MHSGTKHQDTTTTRVSTCTHDPRTRTRRVCFVFPPSLFLPSLPLSPPSLPPSLPSRPAFEMPSTAAGSISPPVSSALPSSSPSKSGSSLNTTRYVRAVFRVPFLFSFRTASQPTPPDWCLSLSLSRFSLLSSPPLFIPPLILPLLIHPTHSDREKSPALSQSTSSWRRYVPPTIPPSFPPSLLPAFHPLASCFPDTCFSHALFPPSLPPSLPRSWPSYSSLGFSFLPSTTRRTLN